LAHSFSVKALNEQEEIIASHTAKLIEKIQSFSEEGESFNLGDWYDFLTFDAIGDLAFEEYYGCLEEGLFP